MKKSLLNYFGPHWSFRAMPLETILTFTCDSTSFAGFRNVKFSLVLVVFYLLLT